MEEHRHFTVLVVEDNPGDARYVEYVLDEVQDRFTLDFVSTLATAIERLARDKYDVILLDLSLPDSNGLESLLGIKKVDSETPVVILTGLADQQAGLQAVQYGAQDFLVKGLGGGEMIAHCIRYAVERQETQKKLAYLAHYDQLTGLANRTLAQECLARAVDKARRSKLRAGLLYIDLDTFKSVNDTLGHASGDELLRAVALRLRHCSRSTDVVGRIGGDEFLLILEDLDSIYQANAVAEKVIEQLAQPVRLQDQELNVTASVGIATYPDCGYSADELSRNADSAMYKAKEQGGNTYVYFCPTMNAGSLHRLKLAGDLRHAITGDELFLLYQPRVDIMYQRMAGVEALVRWRHPEQGVVYPKEFIPIAEQNRLITEIGRWVLSTACAQMASWDRSGLGELTLSVNLSHKQLEQPGFLSMVETVLDKTGLAPGRLMFEITESTLMNRKQVALASLVALHGMGIGISIDDFGTGYSSLDSLKRMHIDELKIDRSFLHNIGDNEDNAEIVRTIISMAENLHLEVAAEGVEKADQLEFLAANGCGLVQGYYFGKPMVPRELVTLAQRGILSQMPLQGLTG